MKTFLKRLLAVPVIVFGVVMMLLGTYMNFFVKLPMALGQESEFSAYAGILVGTIIGTGILIAICIAIIAGGCKLWDKG